MKRVLLGVVLGLGVGTAVSLGAQTPVTPCARSWIFWERYAEPDPKGGADDRNVLPPITIWEPIIGFSTEALCRIEFQRMLELRKHVDHPLPDTTYRNKLFNRSVMHVCFAADFDPRPR